MVLKYDEDFTVFDDNEPAVTETDLDEYEEGRTKLTAEEAGLAPHDYEQDLVVETDFDDPYGLESDIPPAVGVLEDDVEDALFVPIEEELLDAQLSDSPELELDPSDLLSEDSSQQG